MAVGDDFGDMPSFDEDVLQRLARLDIGRAMRSHASQFRAVITASFGEQIQRAGGGTDGARGNAEITACGRKATPHQEQDGPQVQVYGLRLRPSVSQRMTLRKTRYRTFYTDAAATPDSDHLRILLRCPTPIQISSSPRRYLHIGAVALARGYSSHSLAGLTCLI